MKNTIFFLIVLCLLPGCSCKEECLGTLDYEMKEQPVQVCRALFVVDTLKELNNNQSLGGASSSSTSTDLYKVAEFLFTDDQKYYTYDREYLGFIRDRRRVKGTSNYYYELVIPEGYEYYYHNIYIKAKE